MPAVIDASAVNIPVLISLAGSLATVTGLLEAETAPLESPFAFTATSFI